MNRFFNKMLSDLNPSFDGISKISDYNFDKFELKVLRIARLFLSQMNNLSHKLGNRHF